MEKNRKGVSGQEICLEWQSAQFERDEYRNKNEYSL